MPNYTETKLYELIEHDESGEPVVYRGHTTQPLHQRLAGHRRDFKLWKEDKYSYVSSYEVLKHGPARIELVRTVCCLNKKEANREEGKFIRELPTCVNILKNKYATRAEWYEANKDILISKTKAYHQANKQTRNAKQKEYHQANKQTLNAKQKEYRRANKQTILAYKAEKIQCECGAIIARNNLANHRNTWKHFCDFIHI
jgi:glycerol-3-phosphate dehydrogenase